MAEKYCILVVNPGSTSTKVALFENENDIFSASVAHSKEELQLFPRISDQYAMRFQAIQHTLDSSGLDLRGVSAVVGRGGLLKPERGEHASNLGGLIANEFASRFGVPAFIVDPVVVDEMEPVAKISGLPGIERRSIFHALNQRAVAKKAAEELRKPYPQLNLIVAHLGGGISIGCHRKGVVVDVNNALDGDGPFSPERSGGLPSGQLADMCFSGEYTKQDVKKKLVGQGGMVAHLGTNDLRNVKDRIRAGDEKARLVYEAMIYQISKLIGASAVVLDGRVDAIVISGGLAMDGDLTQAIARKVDWIAAVLVYPGEEEMHALAKGALEVLRGESKPKFYS
jgi:butyrate kinase